MALNGINLPLAFTGQEALWQEVHWKHVTGVLKIYDILNVLVDLKGWEDVKPLILLIYI